MAARPGAGVRAAAAGSARSAVPPEARWHEICQEQYVDEAAERAVGWLGEHL
jgi:hypothetical protein